LKKDVDALIYTYSTRNRGQNIMFCLGCAKLLGKIAQWDRMGTLHVDFKPLLNPVTMEVRRCAQIHPDHAGIYPPEPRLIKLKKTIKEGEKVQDDMELAMGLPPEYVTSDKVS
jgi:hypothetical protein